MEQGQVEEGNACDEEGKEVVDGIEAHQSAMGDGVASSEPGHNGSANNRDGGEERGDHRSASEGHLASREYVAYEGSGHQEDEEKAAVEPSSVPRRSITGVEEAFEEMEVGGEEEEGGAIGVEVPE